MMKTLIPFNVYNPMNDDAIFFIVGYLVLNGMRHNEWIETNKALTQKFSRERKRGKAIKNYVMTDINIDVDAINELLRH